MADLSEVPTNTLLKKTKAIVNLIKQSGKPYPEINGFNFSDNCANKPARQYYAKLRENFFHEFSQVVDTATMVTAHTVSAPKKERKGKKL